MEIVFRTPLKQAGDKPGEFSRSVLCASRPVAKVNFSVEVHFTVEDHMPEQVLMPPWKVSKFGVFKMVPVQTDQVHPSVIGRTEYGLLMIQGSKSFPQRSRRKVGAVIPNNHKVLISLVKEGFHRIGQPLFKGGSFLHPLVKVKHRDPSPFGFHKGLPGEVLKNPF